ncbi:hypothetical protein ACIBSS_30265 [Micromonospora aurantiaca]|uniref:hypothetical protein n=1 Tax=Micromonospora aurantiaca (nom. illeg.) TaxID=47850 RepID=UPI0011AD5E99
MTTSFGQSTVLGYPHIGAHRELKKAVEAYWAGRIDAEKLAATAAALREEVWRTLRDARLDAIPSNTFSYYDHVLDTAVAVGAIPHRFARLGLGDLDTYFAMARGVDAEPALELTKWFDTNYHYLVPEIGSDTTFAANPDKALREYREVRDLGIDSHHRIGPHRGWGGVAGVLRGGFLIRDRKYTAAFRSRLRRPNSAEMSGAQDGGERGAVGTLSAIRSPADGQTRTPAGRLGQVHR